MRARWELAVRKSIRLPRHCTANDGAVGRRHARSLALARRERTDQLQCGLASPRRAY